MLLLLVVDEHDMSLHDNIDRRLTQYLSDVWRELLPICFTHYFSQMASFHHTVLCPCVETFELVVSALSPSSLLQSLCNQNQRESKELQNIFHMFVITSHNKVIEVQVECLFQ